MSSCPVVPSIYRPAARVAAAALSVVLGGTAANAQPGDIAVTGGYLNMVGGAGALVVTGDRGFSVNGGVSAAAGIFVPYSYCILLDGPCSPGDTVSLRGLWSGTDAPGRFTLDGVTYGSANMTSMRLAFDGSFLLPPLAESATVVAPFVFEGGLSYVPAFNLPGVTERLYGSGVATVSLVPHTIDGVRTGRWRMTEVLYQFGDRVPAPWMSEDVGFPGKSGSASHLDNHFVVNGAGADIWGTADAFHFVHQRIPQEGTLVARVVRQQNTHQFAKAGVMLRDSLHPAATTMMLDVKPDGGIEVLVRYADGEPMIFIAGGMATEPAVFLRLAWTTASEVTASQSADGITWTLLATAVVPFAIGEPLGGLAVTSHDVATLNTAMFDQVSVSGQAAGANLLFESDFEGYAPPSLGPPGWVSDDFLRQVPSKSETNQPRSGAQNGACWTTTYLDCGMYQEVIAPATGQYILHMYAAADRAGGLVGANVNGAAAASQPVEAKGFGRYELYVMTFTASAGDIIRVWMYSPASPGYVVIDDASLTAGAPVHAITSGTWTIMPVPGPLGSFALQGAGFTAEGTYDGGPVDLIAACSAGRVCAPGSRVALSAAFVNDTPSAFMTFARGTISSGEGDGMFVEFAGAVRLTGGNVILPSPSGTAFPELVTAAAPFALSGTLKGYEILGFREPRLVFEWPLVGHGTATAELLAGLHRRGAGLH